MTFLPRGLMGGEQRAKIGKLLSTPLEKLNALLIFNDINKSPLL